MNYRAPKKRGPVKQTLPQRELPSVPLPIIFAEQLGGLSP
jgi:hypothetical protein